MKEMEVRIMNINGFRKTGNWYKGNLHCHTTNSDGNLTPTQVVEMYQNKGYSFLAISDHDLFTDYRKEFDNSEFIILPAMETAAVLYKGEEKTREQRIGIHHIHAILGTKEMQDKAEKGVFSHMEAYPKKEFCGSWDGAKVAQEMQDDLKAHGCITMYNHPIWSRVKEQDFINTKGLTALEIFNYGTQNESATGFDTIHWDVMLRKGDKIFAVASDDNHNARNTNDSFGGYIVVKAEKLDHESIVQAIIDGSYYSSAGPEIYDWGIKDDVAYVECSAVERVNFMAGNIINAGNTVIFEKEENVMRAEFPLRGNEDYIRVECVDKHGKMAWSNPIFF